MNAQEYNLNIRPGYGYSQTVKVSQNDIGRPLEFHLYDGMDLLSITVGSVITIHATKPSGLGFTETCTWSGSTASISTTESMTQESGAFPAELVITSGDDVLGTANFTFCVERSPHQTGTTDGVAEDLQDIYEQLDDLKEEISELGGLSDDVKQALLQIAQKVAYVDDDGETYYQDLYDALYPPAPPATLVSISAVYTQSGTVYDTDSLNSLKADLVVTAHYDDSTTATVTTYTLSGTLTEGISTITVAYGGKTTTFNVTVSSKYTFYDYIAMTYADNATIPSDSGIHTDIAMSSEYVMETSLKYSSTTNNNTCVMGIRVGTGGTKEFGMFCNGNQNRLGYWYGNTDSTQQLSYLVRNQVNTIVVQPVGVSATIPTYATFKINGTDYSTGSTATGQTWSSWLSFFKYGISSTQTSTGTSDKYCTAQIGETIIKDLSNNVLHDLKPAYDGERYGFYDSVTDTFYYNSTYADKYTCGNWS